MSRTEALLVLSACLTSKKILTPEEKHREKEALLTVVTGALNDLQSIAESQSTIAKALTQIAARLETLP